ncbi:MAG: hypothetical protein JEZ07_12230 [Phycisphaerae bacterium]|nr:hypothetical protein [Phycisphaerae bacterium]
MVAENKPGQTVAGKCYFFIPGSEAGKDVFGGISPREVGGKVNILDIQEVLEEGLDLSKADLTEPLKICIIKSSSNGISIALIHVINAEQLGGNLNTRASEIVSEQIYGSAVFIWSSLLPDELRPGSRHHAGTESRRVTTD